MKKSPQGTPKANGGEYDNVPADDNDFAAGVFARVVASGTEGTKLKLTLLLTPVPGVSGPGDVPNISLWPQEIFQRLMKAEAAGELVLVAQAAVVGTSAKACPIPDVGYEIPLTISKLHAAFDGIAGMRNRNAASSMWQKTFVPVLVKPTADNHSKEAWQGLSDGLTASFQSEAYPAGTIATGAPNGQKDAIDDIRSVRQGDIAVTIDLLRAREVAATVSEAFGVAGARQKLEDEIKAAVPPHPDEPAPDPKNSPDGDYNDDKNKRNKLIADAKAAELKRAKDRANRCRVDVSDHFSKVSQALLGETCPDEPLTTPVAGVPVANLLDPGTGDLHTQMDTALGSHVYGTAQETIPATPKTSVDWAAWWKDTSGRRFFALQSNPSLARLFGLAVDLEVEVGSFNDKTGRQSNEEQFYFLSVKFGSTRGELAKANVPYTWTLAKLGGNDTTPFFWPANRTETYLTQEQCEKLDFSNLYTQYNGVLVLGQATDSGPRYELTSLDVRLAAESQEQRNKERRELPKSGTTTDIHARPMVRQTLSSGGLTLLDRGREAATTGKLAVREFQKKAITQCISGSASDVFLDAEELTVGYRPDIGVYSGSKYEWRGLMNREVRYGTSGWGTDVVQDLIDTLTAKPGSASRVSLDAALVSTPMRLMPANADPHSESKETIVEEIVTSWDGGPMGIDCSGPDKIKTVPEDLPIGREISLPQRDQDDADQLRLAKLRFGWPYRMGFRAVYMGGASPTVSEAADAYEVQGGGALAFPPSKPGAGRSRSQERRFLRHDRIHPPTLLLPGDIAQKGHPLMGFERTAEATVRSYTRPMTKPFSLGPDETGTTAEEAEDDAAQRAAPSQTRRIVVPPRVSQAFAALHGVFDGQNRQIPDDGLKGVRHDGRSNVGSDADQLAGGFPIARPVELHGLDRLLFAESRTIEPADNNSGDAVFATDPNWRNSRVGRYYPDPTVRHYVLALRYAGTDTYLDGDPVVIPIYADPTAPDYPNVRPLAVDVIAVAAKRAQGGVRQNDVLSTGAPINLDPTHSGQRVAAQRATVELYRGEDFELDIWCATEPKLLAKTFAVVETISTMAINGANGGAVTPDKLRDLFGKDASSEQITTALRKAGNWLARQKPDDGFWGVAGLPTADVYGQLAVAEMIDAAMRYRPVDELAAKQVLRVTHAVNRPQYQPVWGDSFNKSWFKLPAPTRPGIRDLSVARPSKANASALRGMDAARRYDRFFKDAVVDRDSSDFLLGGSILIDLDTADGFEIEALVTNPRTSQIDDPARRRSRAERLAGEWPLATDVDTHRQYAIATSDVYGFHVDLDGRVELPRTRVTLLRVDQIRSARQTGLDRRVGELEVLELESFYGLEASTDGAYPSTAAGSTGAQPPAAIAGSKLALVHAFPDGKARRLTLSVVGLSRFAHSFVTAARKGDDGYFKRGEALYGESAASRSDPLDIWLPATMAPAKPVTRSPLPVFSWIDHAPETSTSTGRTTYALERKAMVRVPLRREWFSSGEGERLGVVIWPPNLFELDVADLDQRNVINIPRYPDRMIDRSVDRSVDLSGFEDDDLGPGGAFISRWGGDPIRTGSAQKGTFMPPYAFADLDAGVAGLAKSVSMPIGAESPDEGNKDAAQDRLIVSLLTYEPRFDIGREEWYVDLNIVPGDTSDPFVRLGLVRYQEHAPPALQVSQPVVEWTQLLPSRKVVLDVADGGPSIDVKVTVSGHASTGTAHSPIGDDQIEARNARPIMTASLWFEGADADGRGTRTRLGDDMPLQVAGISVEGETVWKATLPAYPRDQLADMGIGQLFVFVDEIERRRPATYAHEPLTFDEIFGSSDAQKADLPHDEFASSGPRFAARIDIPGAAIAPPGPPTSS